MHKTIGILAILLAAQLVLAAGMAFTGPRLTGQRADTLLIDLGEQKVDRLTIDGSNDQRIVLARQSDRWILPQSNDFPADQRKVDRLLGELKGLKRGLAVGTTASARKRFKVSDQAFERRIVLTADGATLATLYLGTSPAMHQVHARSDADDAVYTAGFSIYDAPLKPQDWEDKGLLKMPQGEISSIALGGMTIARAPVTTAGEAPENSDVQTTEKTSWVGEGLAHGERVNQANASTLAKDLAGLTFGSVLGSEARPEYGMQTPVLDFTVQREGGGRIEYRLGKRDQEKDYVLKVSNRPEYFRLPSYTAEALIKAAGRDQLVVAAADAAPKDDPGAAKAARAKGGAS